MRLFLTYVFLSCFFFGCSDPDWLRDLEDYEGYTEDDYGTYGEDAYESTTYDYYDYGMNREEDYGMNTEPDDETPLTYNFAEEMISQGDSLTNNMKKSVWRVSNPLSSNFGTALSVGPNLFVMDFYNMAEILKDNNSIKDIVLKQYHSSSQLTIKQIIRVSALYGLAFFETKENVTNYLNIAEFQPQHDDELFILGYSRGEFKAINKTGQSVDEGDYYTFTIDHSNLDGITGGPVLNERKQVVGIVFGSIANMLDMIKSNHLKDLIKGNIGLKCSDFINETACLKREIENLTELANQGHNLAQENLALMYYKGEGTAQDYELAFKWFEESAKRDSAFAQYLLALMYYKGEGAAQDYELAFKWFEESADQGYAPSQYLLALMYYKGEGVAQDYELAFKWFEESEKQSYSPAQYHLAKIYNDWAEDVQSGLSWLQESAFQGYAQAQYDLGEAYYEGEGVEQDYELAFELFKKSADQDYAPSQYYLARMYHEGEGVEKNLMLALILLKKSASQGYVPAQGFLKDYYHVTEYEQQRLNI